MGKNFSELGRKAEALIREGAEAEALVKVRQDRVMQLRRNMQRALANYNAVREEESAGSAMMDLRVAQELLAAGQRALDQAEERESAVIRKKWDHVQTLEHYGSVERANLEKLRQLQEKAFGENAAQMIFGLATRINRAEDTRVGLLKSMDQQAAADYVTVETPTILDRGPGPIFSAGLRPPADMGQAGGAIPTGPCLPDLPQTVVLGGTGPEEEVSYGRGRGAQPAAEDRVLAILQDPSLTPEKKQLAWNTLRQRSVQAAAAAAAAKEAQAQRTLAQLHPQLTDREREVQGRQYIENMLEICRENLRAMDVSDGEAMERHVSLLRADYMARLAEDLKNGTGTLYLHPEPDYKAMARQIRSEYNKYPPRYRITPAKRQEIRRGVRNGTVTFRDICAIGREVGRDLDALQDKRFHAFDQIRRRQLELADRFRQARTKQEKERLEQLRRLLVEAENACSRQYDLPEMVKNLISAYRDVGPGTSKALYRRDGYAYGESKAVAAIEYVRSHYPTDWVECSDRKPLQVKLQWNPGKRGYFLPGPDFDFICLDGRDLDLISCAIHEMAHRMEMLFPEILELERQFYAYRTANEPLQHLGPGYDKTEMTRVDHFADSYMGKDYGGSGYELLSMGMEAIYLGRYNLFLDREFRDFMLGLLVSI